MSYVQACIFNVYKFQRPHFKRMYSKNSIHQSVATMGILAKNTAHQTGKNYTWNTAQNCPPASTHKRKHRNNNGKYQGTLTSIRHITLWMCYCGNNKGWLSNYHNVIVLFLSITSWLHLEFHNRIQKLKNIYNIIYNYCHSDSKIF